MSETNSLSIHFRKWNPTTHLGEQPAANFFGREGGRERAQLFKGLQPKCNSIRVPLDWVLRFMNAIRRFTPLELLV